jgi:tRNA-splicing ligase RtcB
MSVPVTVVGDVDPKAVKQMETCAAEGDAIAAAVLADGHFGYSMPVGGVCAYPDYVSPSGVGYDIGCGNMAVATNLLYPDISKDVPGLMDEIFKTIPFGPGKGSGKTDHPVIDRIRTESPFDKVAQLHQKAAQQLGSVGGGNHYVDLFRDEKTDRVWVGVHFGSRGFGHTVATMFLEMAANPARAEGSGKGEEKTEEPPTLIHADSPLGHAYIEAMELAGAYAYAGRETVVQRVLDMLGAVAIDTVHNHHNFAWRENHFGQDAWVVRKGSTPAFPGQRGFVGATMGETSVILEGVDDSADVFDLQKKLMYSTVHGAGRLMSRTAAAGKQRKRWTCSNRDCDWVQPPYTHKPEDGACPACGNTRLTKRWVAESTGAIDWEAANEDLRQKNIELRGAAADEAPLAYKRLDDVLEAHSGTVRILHRLRPIGVAMAGPGVAADD